LAAKELDEFRRVMEELKHRGLLLETDSRLPCVSSLVAGEGIRGSWWGHPRGRAIFRVIRVLSNHLDVVIARLISGKLTYLHRDLWPALLGVATSGEVWQVRGLSRPARALLSQIAEQRVVRTDRPGRSPGSLRESARSLEDRLLIHSEEVHTYTGAHAKILESWDRWAMRSGFVGPKLAPEAARERLEGILADLNRSFGTWARLPWTGFRPARQRRPARSRVRRPE